MKAGFVAVATLLAACGANTTKTQETRNKKEEKKKS